MRRLFPFRSFTSNAANGKASQANDAMNKNKVDEGGTSTASLSPGARPLRSRSRHGASRKESSSQPQLRRSYSFTASAIDCSLDERMMSYSRDLPCSMSNDSDAPSHFGEVERYTWSPERNSSRREYIRNVPNLDGFLETDSFHSRCHACSTGHSPVNSPVALKCRPVRLTNKNKVLDLYIDEEQEVTRLNEKQNQKFPIRSTAPYLGQGRPPRPHSTVPSSPRKEIVENPSYIDADVWHSQLTHEGTQGTCKVASMCHEHGHDARLFESSFENRFEEGRSQSMANVDDIYEDFQDVPPPSPFFYSTSTDTISSATSNYFAADIGCHEQSHGVRDFNLEHDTDEKLLRRAKEVNTCLMVPPVENSKLNALTDKKLSSTEILQLIQRLIEDRKKLAFELSSQIKARLTERFSAKEQYKRSKLELETRARRLEKEKIDIKNRLERELDRRSNDWSVKIERFQSEEQRLQERVRELAEQNVSFQREITLLESYKVDATSRIERLELQNMDLSNELQKVKGDRDNVHNSLVELQDNLTKAIEERDKIREFLEDKEEGTKLLHKIIARLQRTSNEQEKTITSLRQGLGAELEKRAAERSDINNRIQMELVRLAGVEQNLRREFQSCTLEMESLRQENIALFNRLQKSEDEANFSTIRLNQELHARVDSLQAQGLSLIDDSSQLCAKLLELIKSKKRENSSDVDAPVAIEYSLKYQSMKGGIANLRQRLRTIKSLLTEKQKEEEIGQSTGGCPLRQEKLTRDDIEIKLREEAMIIKILKEKLLSEELEIEQLQSDLAASVRVQEVLQNEIHRVQDELLCLTHKSKHLEVQVSKKDEIINQVEQDYKESAKELTALRCMLKTICDERNVSWQESKQLRRTVSGLQNEVASLKQKIRALDEDLQLKESEILLREGEISILRDSIDKPFDIICSPQSMKQFGME